MQMGILSNWDTLTLGQTVRQRSRGKFSASLPNNGVNTTADTHANGNTL